MKEHFDKKSLDQLKHLDHDSASKIIAKMPDRLLMRVFASCCSVEQIKQLFQEYDLYAQNEGMASKLGDSAEVMARYRNKVKVMCQSLKRARRSVLIPGYIRERYG